MVWSAWTPAGYVRRCSTASSDKAKSLPRGLPFFCHSSLRHGPVQCNGLRPAGSYSSSWPVSGTRWDPLRLRRLNAALADPLGAPRYVTHGGIPIHVLPSCGTAPAVGIQPSPVIPARVAGFLSTPMASTPAPDFTETILLAQRALPLDNCWAGERLASHMLPASDPVRPSWPRSDFP